MNSRLDIDSAGVRSPRSSVQEKWVEFVKINRGIGWISHLKQNMKQLKSHSQREKQHINKG